MSTKLPINFYLAQIEKAQQALAKKKQHYEQMQLDTLNTQIEKLPNLLGVHNLETVISLIKRKLSNSLTLEPKRNRTFLTCVEKNEVVRRMRVGGTNNTRRILAAKYNVHYQTLQNWAKQAGLVHERKYKRCLQNCKYRN